MVAWRMRYLSGPRVLTAVTIREFAGAQRSAEQNAKRGFSISLGIEV